MARRKLKDNYAGLLEDWKINLIIKRARKHGFSRHELEDILQELVLFARDFEHDPRFGLSELLLFTIVIDRRIVSYQRKYARDDRRLRVYRETHGAIGDQPAPDPVSDDHAIQMSLAMDVNAVISNLPPQEQEICQALKDGQSLRQISVCFGISRHQLERVITHLRHVFTAAGLND